MNESTASSTTPSSESAPEIAIEDLGHPSGTLAIVLLYAALFAFGWAGLYLFQFIPRGLP